MLTSVKIFPVMLLLSLPVLVSLELSSGNSSLDFVESQGNSFDPVSGRSFPLPVTNWPLTSEDPVLGPSASLPVTNWLLTSEYSSAEAS